MFLPVLFIIKETTMTEFWDEAFKDKQEMWGFEPANAAVQAKDFFIQNGVKNILIPGIGYGRNAVIFKDDGITVTGIEISQTAIDLARKRYGTDVIIHHGSVADMPFDNKQYDGIFCHGLIHLLDKNERNKLIQDCYNQLSKGGYMIFTTIAREAKSYGQGTCVGKDRFEMFGGVRIFFYHKEAILEEFGNAGLLEVSEVEENYPFYLIKCRKGKS